MSVVAPAIDANPLREGLEQERVPDASCLVIFGASGDLTQRKLIPALYSLAHDGLLPAGQTIIGLGLGSATATVDGAGLPDVRMVLMNARDHRGFVFFTNFDSRKGEELLANPRAALVFHWKSLRRQFRARGPVEIVTPAEADAYFATRARVSQLGANASRQSRPLDRKSTLIDAVDRLKAELGDSAPVPRPANWSGFRIVPIELEFWKDGAFRLHDRVRFSRIDANAAWSRQRLYP